MYEMFSKEGNAAVAAMVRRMAYLSRDSRVTDDGFLAKLRREVASVGKRYPEVSDTASFELVAVDLVYLTGRNYWGVAPSTSQSMGPRRWSKRALKPKLSNRRRT